MNKDYTLKITGRKKKHVEEIKAALTKYNVICIFDLNTLPSSQLQLIRHKLRSKAEFIVKKKRLIKIAINEIQKEKNLTHLLPYIEKGNPSLILTNEDPFSLYKTIKASKTFAAAKAGQIAPKDLIAEPGPTNFPPGPIIGELGQAGIIAAVEQGKVVIKKEAIIARKGDVITQKKADALSKLGIQPMEIGMKILAALQDKIIHTQDILDVDEQFYIDTLKSASQQAYNFTLIIGYITEENIKPLVRKAFTQAKHIAEQHNILTSETIKNELKKAELAAIKLKEKLPEEIPTSTLTSITSTTENTALLEISTPAQPPQPASPPQPSEKEDAKTHHEKEKQSHVYSSKDEEVAINLLDALKEKDIKEKARKSPSQVYSKADEQAAIKALEKLKDRK